MEENNFKTKKIETYTDDMVRAIRDDRTGMIKKIINEEEEQEAEKANSSPDSSRNKTFIFLGVLLLVLSVSVLSFLIFFTKKDITIEVAPKYPAYIFSDKSGFKDITNLNKEKIGTLVYNTISNSVIPSGKIESFNLTENNNIIGFTNFASKMEVGILSSDISRVFEENFLIGAYNYGEKKAPFILLRNNSFQDAFVLMRAWEDKMVYDLHGLIGLELSAETNYLFTKDFETGIVANKNAKILYDDEGGIVLMYVFFDNSFVIITNSKEATNEVVTRLSSSEIKK